MAFTWTYPDPLDPNQPSLIGNHLRNVIPSLAIYIQELCDAIDTLRDNIGQAPYNWTVYRPEVGDILLYEYYRKIQLRLDELIEDYEYSSVIDILGRTWSSYQENRYGSTVAKWQIIQDFRDICDGLCEEAFYMEQWTTFTNLAPIKYYVNTINDRIYWAINPYGDMGIWTNETYGDNIWYIKEESLKYDGITQATIYGDFDYYVDALPKENELRYIGTGGAYTWQREGVGWTVGNQVNYPSFWVKDIADKNIILTSDKYFKFKGKLDGTLCHTYTSDHPIYEDGNYYSYPGATISLQFGYNDTKFLTLILHFYADPSITLYTNTTGTGTNNVVITKRLTYPYGDIEFDWSIWNYLSYILDWDSTQEYKLRNLSFRGHLIRILSSGSLPVGSSVTLEADAGDYDIRINKIGLVSSGS